MLTKKLIQEAKPRRRNTVASFESWFTYPPPRANDTLTLEVLLSSHAPALLVRITLNQEVQRARFALHQQFLSTLQRGIST